MSTRVTLELELRGFDPTLVEAALLAALAEEADVDLERHPGPTLAYDLLRADLPDAIAALDEVELDGRRLRGHVRGRLSTEAQGVRTWWAAGVDPDDPDTRHLLLAFDPAVSLRAQALNRAGDAAMESGGAFHLLPHDGGAAQDRAWIRPALAGGPLSRLLGIRSGTVTVAELPEPPPLVACIQAPWDRPPDAIERDLRAGAESPLILQPSSPPAAPLAAGLRSLGLSAGDTVMVHASMRAVGCDADALLDALEEVVGPRGALLFLLCADPSVPFDAGTSAAWDDLGVLPEVFRTRPGVCVNDHPIARFGAWGAGARDLVEHPPVDDYYGPGSPLERLVQRGGRVLRLGADTNTITLLHHAEYRLTRPDLRRIRHRVDVAGPDGTEVRFVTCLDDEHGVRPWTAGEDYFAAIHGSALARGLARQGYVGRAWCELFDAEPLIVHGVAWMTEHLE